MDGTVTRSGRDAGGDRSYRCVIARHLPSPPEPADLLAAAALAAIEAAARLGIRAPIRILTRNGQAGLRQWPAAVRRQRGPEARAALRRLLTWTTGELPNGCLVVSLGAASAAVPDGGAHLACHIDGNTISVRAAAADADPWRRARPAAAELFAEALGALLADPALPSALAPGIGPASRELVLRRFAGQAVDYGEAATVPALFQIQAGRFPDRPAVSFGARMLTYRQLDRLTSGLAIALGERGVRRGDIVPVLLVNSLELPVAYLALMKLGAAFVPLDPAWPAGRIRAVLGVLAPRLLLTAAADRVPADYRGGRSFAVDVDRITPAGSGPAVTPGPEDYIYGVFTSGTTGVPKCAMNRQAGIVNRFRFMSHYFAATGEEVVLQNSKHTFDSAVWQLFWPLTTGARSVLPAQGEFLDLEHTIDTIEAHAITVTDFVSSIFNVMVSVVENDASALRKISSLRHLIVGGEEMNPQMVHRLLGLLPDLRITNGYGPSETSIGMVFHPVSAADGDVIPLGRPIGNCHAVVVDDDLNALPPGASGEIAVGGACVGGGYYGEPARTAEVFVPNPFPELAGSRLYLTGDVGYYDPAGQLFFLGRKDLQVKIGGVRIELGEIEVAAENCPGVRDARVLLAHHGGARSLALFATGDATLTEVALRGCLRRVLPRTSMPRHVVVLAEMPLTENGKVDRKALARILDERLARDAAALAGQAPPAALEDQVLRVLRSALGSPGLSPAASFMDAGGDSIRALSAVAKLGAECGVEIGVQDLFDHPTAADLARMIDLRRAGGAEMEAELALMERDSTAQAGPARRAGRPAGEPRTVLLTGATGFVGSRLLHELLATTTLRVTCLARAHDDAEAAARVRQALTCRGLWQPCFAARIEARAGDLARPRLGLAASVWRDLAHSCDLVLHCGALVNFLFDYRAHRGANVLGTAELLRLARTGRAKPLHHISTLGALSGAAVRVGGRLPEDIEIASTAPPASGYSRSKWVAERQLADARHRGAIVTTIRLGEVMPSADNGYPNTRALTHLLLLSFARLGARPDAAIWSDYTPVDYVAARVVAAIRDRESWGTSFHVFHRESVSFTRLLDRGPAPPERLTCGEFLARLGEAARGDPDLATLSALLPVPARGGEAGLRAMFGGLLSDSPGRYRKDVGASLDARWRLAETPLHAPIAAYLAYLARAADGAAPRPAAIG